MIKAAVGVSVMLLMASGSQACAAEASRQTTGAHTWTTYQNARFAYTLCYPADVFVPQGEADNGDGQRFTAKDGGTLTVWAAYNVLDQSLKEAFEEDRARTNDPGTTVTYEIVKSSGFVRSGFRGGNIFYNKVIAANAPPSVIPTLFVSFILSYPSALKGRYDPLVSTISGCIKPPSPEIP